MKTVVKISPRGRITIPKELRDRLGLKAGDYLLIRTEGDKVKLRKIEPIEKFAGILKGAKSYSDDEIEEMIEEAIAEEGA
ncbi:AbrB/MazE/SpoVT family DNA-binding domain-containing protein [Hydrogenivirga sp. 128-5-R1-1]|uniref:AbrB/MazE/SpoVT family DNA-binding domain-containing protein n=1 Tax=Hydrogenivirga sp. 128-5-R1-1 TaxID=392423 RepID=UPI00015EF06C|nr:AbrB/MazE/SpoVT family DNA-binding domain-containing protein [Hydrogenivirga sp. 128-5-R1-1]EDP74658.1 transcriptional regulator, AbrB family protein [Hydrogenivirga sp. 128-5-R1-1]